MASQQDPVPERLSTPESQFLLSLTNEGSLDPTTVLGDKGARLLDLGYVQYDPVYKGELEITDKGRLYLAGELMTRDDEHAGEE